MGVLPAIPRLPSLYIPWPQCGHCGTDVHMEDDTASCPECRIQWSAIQEDVEATPLDSSGPCGHVNDPPAEREYDYNGSHWVLGDPQPCILPEDHSSKHLCPYDITSTVIE